MTAAASLSFLCVTVGVDFHSSSSFFSCLTQSRSSSFMDSGLSGYPQTHGLFVGTWLWTNGHLSKLVCHKGPAKHTFEELIMNMRWEGGQHWSGREEWEKCKWGWGCSQKFGYSIRKQEICKSFLSIGESLVGLRRKSYVFNMGESTGSTCVNVCERSPIRGFVCGYGYLGIFAFMFSW